MMRMPLCGPSSWAPAGSAHEQDSASEDTVQPLDKQFLTLAPQVAGRDDQIERSGLVAGTGFAPERPVWGTLAGVKRGGSHLFLRYAFEWATEKEA